MKRRSTEKYYNQRLIYAFMSRKLSPIVKEIGCRFKDFYSVIFKNRFMYVYAEENIINVYGKSIKNLFQGFKVFSSDLLFLNHFYASANKNT